MTRPALEQLQEVLANLAELVDLGHQQYQTDRLVRWSVERLWVFAGNLADAYCAEAGVPVAVEPWSELVAERNVLAHYLPDAINYERLWFDPTTDLPGLRQQVDEASTETQ